MSVPGPGARRTLGAQPANPYAALYAQRVRWRTRACWSISVLEGPAPDRLAPSSRCSHPVLSAADVHDARAGFVADPFQVAWEGRHYLFFEVYDYRRDRGAIGLATSPDGYRWDYAKLVLEEPIHLSYPHVFRHHGAFYMLPETHQGEVIRLYRATRFPDRWRFERELIAGRPYVDPTLLVADGGCWLYAGVADTGDLRLFQAPGLLGPWSEHPASPLLAGDLEHARPAGRCVFHDGHWLRFAQSSVDYYGARINGYRVLRLDATGYAEEPLPGNPLLAGSGRGWNAFGMHHLDLRRRPEGGWHAVADGFDLRYRWPMRRFWRRRGRG